MYRRRHNPFWEMSDIYHGAQAHQTAATAMRKTSDFQSELKAYRQALDKMLLINRAMWEIMAEKMGMDEDYLMDKVNEIDLRDGKKDGKLTKDVAKCRSCGRNLMKGHERCLYCGKDISGADAFDRVSTGSDGVIRQIKPL
jgi:hypothetical protein